MQIDQPSFTPNTYGFFSILCPITTPAFILGYLLFTEGLRAFEPVLPGVDVVGPIDEFYTWITFLFFCLLGLIFGIKSYRQQHSLKGTGFIGIVLNTLCLLAGLSLTFHELRYL